MKSTLSIRVRAAAVRAAVLALLLMGGSLVGAGAVWGQTVQQRLDAFAAHLKQLEGLAAKMPASTKDKLSSAAQHELHMAAEWDKIEPQLARSAATLNSPLNGRPFQARQALRPRAVSDPSTDLLFSRMSGFVQSETSTAWCGNTVVVAYNDTGSIFESFPLPRGVSGNGYSRSTDSGLTFTDQGYVNAGANLSNFLGGDGVVTCTDQNTFYESSIFQSGDPLVAPVFGASVSKSTDGGETFADPVPVVLKDGFSHFIDKPWMAVDPSNPQNLYVTYTDLDGSGTVCPIFRTGIELVASKDGGATWSAPTVVDNGCSPNYSNQGSNVAVDGKGNVYVAWEQYPVFLPTNEIDIAKSTNGGAGFEPKVVVSSVNVPGDNFGDIHSGFFTLGVLQGGFRNNEFPSLAIDLSRGSGKGPLYIAWNDGRFNSLPDAFPLLAGANYHFADAVVSRSDDGGSSWSSPVKVDNNAGAASAAPVDHYQPGIAVDRNGRVGMCWYDRRRDPENFLIDRECGASADSGQSWTNTRITARNFSPIIAEDLLINPSYMGDYDGVASDLLGKFEGFLGAYGDNAAGNPDVRISRRFGGSDDSGALDNN